MNSLYYLKISFDINIVQNKIKLNHMAIIQLRISIKDHEFVIKKEMIMRLLLCISTIGIEVRKILLLQKTGVDPDR